MDKEKTIRSGSPRDYDLLLFAGGKKGEEGKVTSALLGPERRKQLGKMARISVLGERALSYQL